MNPNFCFVNISLAGILQRLDVFRQDCWESTRKGFSSLLWNKKEAGAKIGFCFQNCSINCFAELSDGEDLL